MRKLILLLILLLAAIPAQAQTATPTTSPVVHYAGEYWFYSDSNITYSGSWSNVTDGYLTRRQTSSTAAYAAFTVSDSICYLAITLSVSATWNIQINGTDNYAAGSGSPSVQSPFIVDTSGYSSDFTVKIYPTGTGVISLGSFRLWQCGDYLPQTPVPTATAIATSTPYTPAPSPTPPNTPVDTATAIDIQPTIDAVLTLIAGGVISGPTNTPTITSTPSPAPYVLITLTAGQTARFDYVADTGDILTGSIITLLLFSLWGMFFFAVFVLWRSK